MGKEHLGGNDQLLPRGTKVFKSASQDLFARAQGIHIGSVEKVDATFQRLLDKWTSLSFLQHPIPPAFGAIGHGAQADS